MIGTLAQCEIGCVPDAAIRRPFSLVSLMISPRRRVTSRRACVDVGADRRADLDDRLVHLALDLVLQPLLAFGKHLGDVRLQLARLRIDDLKLFFDPEGERWAWRHGEQSKASGLGPRAAEWGPAIG